MDSLATVSGVGCSMGKANFKVECPDMGFSRFHEIPIDSRGYVHALAEDLDKVLIFYQDKIDLHKIRTLLNAMEIIARNISVDNDLEELKSLIKEAKNV